MASGWFSNKAIELVKARSLFVKVFPTPANLSERRAVLHALKRHGQIEIFKRLPNPETFVCAPTKSEVASELINRSPLTFKFVSETLDSIEAKSLPGISPVGVAAPIQIHENKARLPPSPDRAAQASPNDMVKTFTMHINPSQSYYEHKTNIRLSPIHGPWPKTPEQDQDFVYFALKEVVPNDIAREGLCDWHSGGQLSGEPAAIRAQHEHSRLWHIRERQMRRRKTKELEEDGDGALVALKSLDGQEKPADQQRDGLDETASGDLEGIKSQGPPQEQALSDPFEEMERMARGADYGKPAPKEPVPAWVRRKQVKLNPLADGKHYKIDKKVPLHDPRNPWKQFEFKYIYNSQMDKVKLPTEEKK
ncbi:hypothetical protein VM1G_09908 [Cytospora mali]|uniref:Uncharacterized protein n=1 Tax=Cytospora mali TaxID=578113 RepID=A0A194WCH4_CYTMA|nr:hypothetical protein VM1G_09908 [Valsa mali]